MKPYVRTANRIENLNGYVRRYGIATVGGKKYRRASSIEGGLPDVSGSPEPLTREFTTPVCSFDGFPRQLTTNERNRLSTELLLKAGRRQWSVGEFLGESRQTISHLAHTTSTVLNAFRYSLKGDMRKVAKTLGVKPKQLKSGASASDRWLEYQYGWLPLMSDIHDAYHVTRKGLVRPQLTRVVRRINLQTYDMAQNSGTTTPVVEWEVSGTSSVSAQAIAYYRLKSSMLDGLQQLGLVNPAEVAWALLPYSFVIDWFLPIQSMLEASTATIGLTFVDGCITRVAKVRATVTYRNHYRCAVGGSTMFPDGATPMYAKLTSGMSREVVSAFTPDLYVKNPLSSTHALSALALLRQLTKR